MRLGIFSTCIALALLSTHSPVAQTASAKKASTQTAGPQPLTSAQIDALAERTLKAFDVPGIAVCVIKDGKVIHQKGYGVRSLANKQPVDENTLFGIASNSKAFTTAALGILADEGKLDWDDKVRKYIPEFQLYDPYVTEEFTIRDLLCHRSGLGLGAGDLMFFPPGGDFTVSDIIHNLRFLKPVTSFRSEYAYDNNLYILAGEIIARVSGMSWDTFIEKRILQPLGMTHSAASFTNLKDTSDIIDAHAPVEGKIQPIHRHISNVDLAAGGIYSSIADLSKWVLLHLDSGRYDQNKRLFSLSVLKERWTPQTIVPFNGPGPYNTHFATYGLGFNLVDVKGYKQIAHTGGLEGMVTQITMIPELNLGIIVLTNQEVGFAFFSITNQIKDAYLGIKGTDRVSEYSAIHKRQLEYDKKMTDSIYQELARNSNTSASSTSNSGTSNSNTSGSSTSNSGTNTSLTPYQGSYRDPWLGEVTIGLNNGHPWFTSKRSPKLNGPLTPFKANSFIVKWVDRSMNADAFVLFDLDEHGLATGFHMKAVSEMTDFSYDFQDLSFKKE